MIKFAKAMAFFVMLVALVACQYLSLAPTPTDFSLPTRLPVLTPTPTSTHPIIIPTTTTLITPIITATPLNAVINTEDDLARIVNHLYTSWSPCIGYNFAKSSPGMPPPRNLEFIEVDSQSDPYMQNIIEIANNTDGSYQAFTACENTDNCHPKIFVRDIAEEKVYEINWEGRMPWRPIDSVIWMNTEILGFYQSVNPERAQVIVINFKKRIYLFDALIFPDYFCSTPTSTH